MHSCFISCKKNSEIFRGVQKDPVSSSRRMWTATKSIHLAFDCLKEYRCTHVSSVAKRTLRFLGGFKKIPYPVPKECGQRPKVCTLRLIVLKSIDALMFHQLQKEL